jgi:hypothetical protein
MRITVKVNFDLTKLDIVRVNQIGLVNGSQALVAIAAKNAPYETGTLSKSIGAQPGAITTGTKSVRVGPRKVKYAVRREFENRKNPSKKFYMKRTADRGEEVVKREFEKAVQIVTRSV